MRSNHELMAAVELASKMYHTELMRGSGPDRDRARGYVASRRLFAPMVELFAIGYSPPTTDRRPWIATKIPEHKLLLEAGILHRSESGEIYDPMQGRIVFPQVNAAGRFLGFVGRDITGTRSDKYLSTTSTPIFRRAEVLYRIDRARLAIEQERTAIVVEGLMDAALMYQVGVRNVVATGTKGMTDSQAQLLGRYAHDLEIMFDNDDHGREGFEQVRRRRGGYFHSVTWRDYPGKFNDPADWVSDQIDRAIQSQQAAT